MWPFRRKEPVDPFPLEERLWLVENLPNIVKDDAFTPPGCVGMNKTFDRTPDRLWLERHEWRLLFVYDEMMHNRSLYHLIAEDSINLGKAFTQTEDWCMFKKKLGEETFPIAFRSKIGIQRRIKGEIHAVRPHLFWNVLDKRFLNGSEFKRERVKLWMPYHVQQNGVSINAYNEFIQPLTAFMYVGVSEYWDPQIDNGFLFKPVLAFRPNAKWVDGKQMNTYYYYSRLEDETNF